MRIAMHFLFALALAAAVGLSLSAVSLGPKLALAQAAAPSNPDEPDKLHWQSEYKRVLSQVEQARARLEQSQRSYTKGKQRGRMRGEQRFEIRDELAAAKQALAAAEAQLESFPDEARRAGAPPGWFREINDDY